MPLKFTPTSFRILLGLSQVRQSQGKAVALGMLPACGGERALTPLLGDKLFTAGAQVAH